jgi:hypothetical protein
MEVPMRRTMVRLVPVMLLALLAGCVVVPDGAPVYGGYGYAPAPVVVAPAYGYGYGYGYRPHYRGGWR